jgi:hypothetical protein
MENDGGTDRMWKKITLFQTALLHAVSVSVSAVISSMGFGAGVVAMV